MRSLLRLAGGSTVAVLILLSGCARNDSNPVQVASEPAATGGNPTTAPPPASSTGAPMPRPGATPAAPAPAPSAAPVEIAPPPKPVGAPVAVAPAGLRLAYRFKKGDSTEYEMNVKQEVTMKPQGGPPAGQPGPIIPPDGMKMTSVQNRVMVNQVKSVTPGGEARVSTRARDGEIRMTLPMMGDAHVQIKDGKATVLQNGQPVPQSGSMTDSVTTAMAGMYTNPREMRVAASGKVLPRPADSGGSGVRGMLGGQNVPGQDLAGYGMLVFPNRPLKPGDSWTDVQVIPLPASRGQKPAKMTLTTKFTLKEILQQEGRQIAVIDSESTIKMPQTGFAGPMVTDLASSKIRMTGSAQFDVAAGELASGYYRLDLALELKMGAPAGMPGDRGPGGGPAAPGASGPQGMSLNGGATIKVTRKS